MARIDNAHRIVPRPRNQYRWWGIYRTRNYNGLLHRAVQMSDGQALLLFAWLQLQMVAGAKLFQACKVSAGAGRVSFPGTDGACAKQRYQEQRRPSRLIGLPKTHGRHHYGNPLAAPLPLWGRVGEKVV